MQFDNEATGRGRVTVIITDNELLCIHVFADAPRPVLPAIHDEGSGIYKFSLLGGAGLDSSVNRTVTLTIRDGDQTYQSVAVAACKQTGGTPFVPHDLQDLWKLNAVAAAILPASNSSITVMLGGNKTTVTGDNVWLAPAVSSIGSAPDVPGMNLSLYSPKTAPWTSEGDGEGVQCLSIINWSNLHYSAWLRWGTCTNWVHTCVKTTVS